MRPATSMQSGRRPARKESERMRRTILTLLAGMLATAGPAAAGHLAAAMATLDHASACRMLFLQPRTTAIIYAPRPKNPGTCYDAHAQKA